MKSQKTYCQFLSFGYCLTVLGDTKGGGLLSAYERAGTGEEICPLIKKATAVAPKWSSSRGFC